MKIINSTFVKTLPFIFVILSCCRGQQEFRAQPNIDIIGDFILDDRNKDYHIYYSYKYMVDILEQSSLSGYEKQMYQSAIFNLRNNKLTTSNDLLHQRFDAIVVELAHKLYHKGNFAILNVRKNIFLYKVKIVRDGDFYFVKDGSNVIYSFFSGTFDSGANN